MSAHAFANNFWGKDDAGYQRLVQRMHHAKLTCEELQLFYKERMAIEHEYAKRLSMLAKKALGSKESGSLKRSLDVIRATTEQMATSHETVAKQISEEFLSPLDSFSTNMRDRRKTSEDVMTRLTKAKKTQDDMTEKARDKYVRECNKISGYKAQQNLLTGKELEKNNRKLENSMFEVEKLQRDYQAAINVLSQTSDNWNASWKTTCDRFQDLESERLNYTKTNLWDFANALSTACVNDDEGFEAVRVSLEQCEASADIEYFVSECGTGAQIMDPPQFTNYLKGFTRDANTGGYTLAKFGGENDDEEDSEAERQHEEANNSFTSSQILNMSHQSHLSIDNTPNWQPSVTAVKTAMIEDDGYSSSSPYQGSMSPASSVYSGATSISHSPVHPNKQQFEEQQFQPTPVEQKRRSWAKPFKRKSSPDLGKVWKALGESQSSVGSGQFDDFELEREARVPARELESPHVRFAAQTAPQQPQQPQQQPQQQLPQYQPQNESRRVVVSKTAREQDPMLAAIDKLKTPPLGTISKKKLARPASMPGIAALHQSPPQPQRMRANDHSDVRQAPPILRRPVGSPSKTPYPEQFSSPSAAAPQNVPQRSPQRERRHSFNPRDYEQQLHNKQQESRMMNRRSAEIYAQQPVQQAQQVSQQQFQQQQRPTQRALAPQSRPRPKSAVATNDLSLLPSRTSDGRPVIRHARAQFDFRARLPIEVSFRKGDILLVTHIQEDGWWESEVLTTKMTGVAPGNFMQTLG